MPNNETKPKAVCQALEHEIDKHYDSWVFKGPEPLNLQVYYPIVVLQGDLFEARPTKRSLRLVTASHVQYRRSVIARQKPVTYQIDVITERYLPQYLDLVETEMKRMGRLLRRRHQKVRRAIDRIVKDTRRLRSKEKIRGRMEF